MDTISLLILGIVQGLTEFLPVSSTGHLIVARVFLGIPEVNGLAVDAVLQLATALAVIVYFRSDIVRLASSALAFLSGRRGGDEYMVFALLMGTVPALVIGLMLEGTMETVFRSAELVAYTLLVGSVIMLFAEFYSKKFASKTSVEAMTWQKGLAIGLFQALALIPGMSRSGMTISGGLFLGFTREAAARFGFLLSVPIIFGSGLKKLLELGASGTLVQMEFALMVGVIASFVSGLLAIHALLLFVRTQPMYVFIVYRVIIAAVILFLPI